MTQSLYEVLGVARDASQDDIKRAYRRLAKQHHPDRDGGDHERMQQVQLAYDVLGDEAKRKHYDETGDTKMKALDSSAMEVLATLFSGYIDQAQEGEDPINVARNSLNNALSELSTAIANHPNLLAALNRKAKALKHKDPESDIYAGIVEQKRAALERGKQLAEQRVPVVKRALELLEDYQSGVAAPRYVGMMGGTFGTASGIDWSELR